MGVIRVPKISIGSVRDSLQGELRQSSGLVVPRCVVEGVVIGLCGSVARPSRCNRREVVPQIVGKNA